MRERAYWAGFLIGVAVMAAIDEIVFHQLLAWHHFFDRATPAIGLISDGILHAAELFALVGGFFLLFDARRREGFSAASAWAGVVVGLGLFQVWDGLIHHKVLRVHQVRYDVELLPYDLAWIGSGLVLLAVGVIVTIAAARRTGDERATAGERHA
nr:DUF2243 domain-containing protein [Agromyces sp. Marseille-P2726]